MRIRRGWLCLGVLWSLALWRPTPLAAAPIRDGGIDPANLGKGDWIYFISAATNKLGGHVPAVVNLPTLMAYYKSHGLQYVIVKAGTGSTNFNGSGNSPQFNSNLIHHAHAAGMLVFAYTRSYGDDVPGEINMAANYFALGADGWVIDAEAEWESSRLGTNGPALATQYGLGLRALFPNKFIAHAPFPIIRFHSSFPYKEFGLFCDTVMPQTYWKSIYGNATNAVERMVTDMETDYRNFHNSLTGLYTNAIKPLAPIAQGWSPATNEITTGAEIDEFFDRLRTNANPASVTGYKGINFWRADLHTPDMWRGISSNVLGDVPGPPSLTLQPQGRAVAAGFSNVTFTAWGTGSKPFSYRWRFNGTNLPGATSPNLVLTNIQIEQAGAYSVIITNIVGATTSLVAALTVTSPPALFSVSATAGARSAIVTWRSTNLGSSQVEFGLTTNYGSSTAHDLLPATNHSMLLTGLRPGTNYFFGVISRAGANTWRSDGWSFSTAGEFILDTAEAVFSGGWTTASSSPDKYGADYRYASSSTNGTTATALYTPNIVTRGNYDVFVWHPQGANRSTNAPVTILFNGALTTTRVNQEANGGRWVQVGTNLNFAAGTGGLVRISNSTDDGGQVVMADAVRFVYRVEQDAPSGQTVPDWWAHYYFGSNINAQIDQDGDGQPAWAEYLLGTAPHTAASRLDFQMSQAGGMRASFSPYCADRLYQLQERLGPGNWHTLTNLLLTVSSNGQASFAIPAAANPLGIYRLKVDWQR